MKYIDYIYFNIYSWYNDMKKAGRKVNPQSLTSMAFGICIGGWFILITVFYLQYNNHKVFISDFKKYIFIFVTLISAGLINEFYSSNNRFQKVYNKYINTVKPQNRKKTFLFSLLIIFLPYIILVLFGVLLSLLS